MRKQKSEKSVLSCRKRFLMICFILAMEIGLCSCGKSDSQTPRPEEPKPAEPEQEIKIHYHAEDGEYVDTSDSFLVAGNETLESAKEKGKTILTMTAMGYGGDGALTYSLADMVNAFNNRSEEYFVDVTLFRAGDELAAGRDRNLIELAAGNGPDIMEKETFEPTQELLRKGVLAELSSYLQASGITEEKYFPVYRAVEYEGGVYGITGDVSVVRYAVDAKMLENGTAPKDMEALVDQMLAYPGEGTFFWSSGEFILDYFLGGSETVWGMVDWENGTCDFTGGLLEKMLKAAKRYAEYGRRGCEPIMDIRGANNNDPKELTTPEPGWVFIDYYFDDGHFPVNQNRSTLMINSGTRNLEGAWAFLSYTMSREGQGYVPGTQCQREAWKERIAEYMKLQKTDPHVSYHYTQEDAAAQEAVYNMARNRPLRADKIREIILEEAEAFFTGDKNETEAVGIIQNRVQLYLDEIQD